MQYEIYLDWLFLFNVWMNWLILELTCLILKCQVTHRKLFGYACLISALYCGVVLLPFGTILEKSVFFQLGGTGVLLLRVVRHKSRKLLQGAVTYYIAAFCLAGVLEWTQAFLSPFRSALTAGAAGAVMAVSVQVYRTFFLSERYQYEIELVSDGNKQKVRALFDSGNALNEPVSGTAVHIITRNVADRLFVSDCAKRFRVIPYHSIGKPDGILNGYFADYMIVWDGKKEKRIEHPMLGIYEGLLSENGDYEMILNSRTFV